MYDQAIQDGYSLVPCTSPARPVPASPTPTHMTDLPIDTYLPLPQLVIVLTLDKNISTMISYQRGGEGCPSASFPGHP